MSADDHLLPLRDDRPAWHQHAACRGMTALFFPPRGENAHHAKAVCATCPVRDECLNDALDHGDKHGVWGGASENERRRMRSNLAATKACRWCGGVFTHERRKGQTGGVPLFCSDDCRDAARRTRENAKKARYHQRKRGAA